MANLGRYVPATHARGVVADAETRRIAELMRQLASEVELLTAENDELRRTVADDEQQRERGTETPPEQIEEAAEPPQSPEKDASAVQADSAPKGGKASGAVLWAGPRHCGGEGTLTRGAS